MAITAYIGLPGSGKTYLMSMDILEAMKRRSRQAWVNFPLAGAHYFDDFRQIQQVTKGIIAADELNALAHAHDWHNLDEKLLTLWTQSRKLGIDFWYTTQGFHMVNNQIRYLTNWVWVCRRLFGGLHVAEKLDACDVERDRKRPKIYAKRYFYIRPAIFSKYDTYFRIKPLGYDLDGADPEKLPIFDDFLQLPQASAGKKRGRPRILKPEDGQTGIAKNALNL